MEDQRIVQSSITNYILLLWYCWRWWISRIDHDSMTAYSAGVLEYAELRCAHALRDLIGSQISRNTNLQTVVLAVWKGATHLPYPFGSASLMAFAITDWTPESLMARILSSGGREARYDIAENAPPMAYSKTKRLLSST